MFSGSLPALVTPFCNGRVDGDALAALIARQISAGAGGLVACGTTGEASALSHEEHLHVISVCVGAARGRAPVIAGVGGGRFEGVVDRMAHAKAVGADAALVVTPYYVRPSQDGLLAYFSALNDAVALPIVAYNVPGRTGVDMAVSTVGKIAALSNVIGLKDATGDLSRVARHRALVPDDFVLLSGDDPSAVGFMAQGGVGCISVTANVAAEGMARLMGLCLKGDFGGAAGANRALARLHGALFLEASPSPTKRALKLLGLCEDDVRLPLAPIGSRLDDELKAAMAEAGVT